MPKLLDEVRNVMRTKHYSLRTEQTYINWIKQYIIFNQKRHPAELGAREVTNFLSHLAVNRQVAASTQNQALAAILFLYRYVLKLELPWLEDVQRAKKPSRVPLVFTREEVKLVLAQLTHTNWLMASLLYGSGLRLMECLRLRIKDLDFDYQQILVFTGTPTAHGRKNFPLQTLVELIMMTVTTIDLRNSYPTRELLFYPSQFSLLDGCHSIQNDRSTVVVADERARLAC